MCDDIGYKLRLETLGNLSSGATTSSHGLEGILLGDEQRTDYDRSVTPHIARPPLLGPYKLDTKPSVCVTGVSVSQR